MVYRYARSLEWAIGCALLFAGCISRNVVQPALKLEDPPVSRDSLQIREFVLSPGDEVTVKIWRNDDLSATQHISPDGMLSLPLMGSIHAGGMSLTGLRDNVQQALDKYLVNPQVGVSVASTRSQKVFVLGEVIRPGVFQIEDSMNLVEAVSLAGGFTLDAEQRNVLLIRGDAERPQLVSLDMAQVLKEGNLAANVVLQRGDVIYVPESTIADVDRFFEHMRTIILPLLNLETGIAIWPAAESVLGGKTGKAGIRPSVAIPSK